jgi:hypothetical protein
MWNRLGAGKSRNPTLKYRALLQADPDNGTLNVKLGLAYYTDAIEQSDSSSSDDESDRDSKQKDAQKLLGLACKHLKKGTDNGVDTGEAWFSLGSAQYALWEYTWDDVIDEDGDGVDDRLQDAQTSFQAAFRFPLFLADPKTYYQVATIYEDFGSFEGALQMYAHIVTTFPDFPNLGMVLLRAAALCMHPQVGMFDEAVRYWEFLMDSPPPPYSASSVLFQLARAYQLQDPSNSRRPAEAYREAYRMEHKVSLGKAAAQYNKWIQDPQTWRLRGNFHSSNKLQVLASDAYVMAVRLGDDKDYNLYFMLALSLRRIMEKQAGQSAMERAYALVPYNDRVRQKLRVYSLDKWRPFLDNQAAQCTKIQAMVRGVKGRAAGRAYMAKERKTRAERNRAATTIQCQWRFKKFQRTFRKQRALIRKSLKNIQLHRVQHAMGVWTEWAVVHKAIRIHRENNATKIERWYRRQVARIRYEAEKRENERKVKLAVKRIQYRVALQAIKAWDRYVVWIIEVKEPFNATTIQCYWRYLRWRKRFHYERALILKSLERIKIHRLETYFYQLWKMTTFQRMTRQNRAKRRFDKYRRTFMTLKWYAGDYLKWWRNLEAPQRRKSRQYAIERFVDRMIDRKDLRIDPVPVGASFTCEHHERQEEGVKRSMEMFRSLTNIWGKVYGQGGERSLSFINARLPKDMFYRSTSTYYANDIQISILRKELELHHAPVHPLKARQLEIESRFVKTHIAAIRHAPAPLPNGILALTLPNSLRKCQGGYDSTVGKTAKIKSRLRHLTGRKNIVLLKPFGRDSDKPPKTHKMEHRRSWGFPVWFGPGQYGKLEKLKRETPFQVERRLAAAELERMREEEGRQREVDVTRLVKNKEVDFVRFKTVAKVCGPLRPELFFSTPWPGRTYEQLVYLSVSRVQLWWLVVWPVRRAVKERASVLIQKTFRASQGRWEVHLKKTILFSLNRLKRNAETRTFNSWKETWRTVKIARRMMRRAMNMTLTVRWNAWHSMYVKRKAGRQEKMKRVLVKMINAKKWRILAAWYDYVQRLWKIKLMMWRAMAGMKDFCFDVWRCNVRDIVQDRAETNAAVKIQKSFRGMLGKERFESHHYFRTKLAMACQRIVRGYLGRVHVRYKILADELEARKIQRKAQWSQKQADQQAIKKKERARHEEEKVHLQAVHETVRKSMGELPYTKKEKDCAAVLVKDSKEHFEAYYRRRKETFALTANDSRPGVSRKAALEEYVECGGTILDKATALEKARTMLTDKIAENAAIEAKEEYRKKNPPQHSCRKCHSVFYNSHALEVHICEIKP